MLGEGLGSGGHHGDVTEGDPFRGGLGDRSGRLIGAQAHAAASRWERSRTTVVMMLGVGGEMVFEGIVELVACRRVGRWDQIGPVCELSLRWLSGFWARGRGGGLRRLLRLCGWTRIRGSGSSTGRTPTADELLGRPVSCLGVVDVPGDLPDVWVVRGEMPAGVAAQPVVAATRRLHVGSAQSYPMTAAAVSNDVQPRRSAADSIRPVFAHTRRPAQALTDSGFTAGSSRRPAAFSTRAMAIEEDACIDRTEPRP